MSGPRLLLLKADRMVRAHIRSGHFVKQYQTNYKLGQQYKVDVPDSVFEMAGVSKKPVYADWVRLFDKHKHQFKSPEHVKTLLNWVMRSPSYAFVLLGERKMVDVLRENYKENTHPIVGIEFEEKRGSNGYRVATIHFINDAQASGKVADAISRQLSDHKRVVFEFGKDLVKSEGCFGDFKFCVVRRIP